MGKIHGRREPDRKALLAKIRKCLALAGSANEHEAAAALERAQALMADNGISADDVELADVAEALVKGGGAKRPPAWESVLAGAVAKALDCRLIYQQRETADWRWDCRWQFVGVGAAAEIAAYAWTVLYRQLRRQRAAYIAGSLRRCKPARQRVRADVFCQAWANAVYRKVQALAPRPDIVALIDRYIAASAGELAKLAPRKCAANMSGALSDDWRRGHDAGRAANLHAGMDGAAQGQLAA